MQTVRLYKPKQHLGQATDNSCIGFSISCVSRLPVADWPVRRQLNSILAGHLWRPNALQIQKVTYFGLFRLHRETNLALLHVMFVWVAVRTQRGEAFYVHPAKDSILEKNHNKPYKQ
jgi:hypothetical protein